MKFIVIIGLSFALTMFITNTYAISDEKKVLIDELSVFFNTNPMPQSLVDMTAASLRAELSLQEIELDDEFFVILKKLINDAASEILVNSELMRSQNYQIWDKHFDISEIRGLLTFLKTPLGSKFMTKTQEMSVDRNNALMPMLEEFQFTMQVKLLEQLEDAGHDVAGLFEGDLGSLAEPNRPATKELAKLREELCNDSASVNKPIPVYRGPPRYPYLARQFGIEGSVELRFTVTSDGGTEDIRVTNSSPGTIFNAQAIEAVKKYQFCERSKNGKSSIRIRFELDS